MTTILKTIRKHARELHRNRAGLALIEFAYSLPVLLVLGLGGFEVANYTVAHMRVSQLAVSLADNASRLKEEYGSEAPPVREYDVNQVFLAAKLQSKDLDFENHGRAILSSLETNKSKGQWIHWQRCWGNANYSSSYGTEGDGKTGTSFPGMGPTDRRASVKPGYAIMFAEVYYDYTPLAYARFIPVAPIHKVAAMYARDSRDLTEIKTSAGVTPSKCN